MVDREPLPAEILPDCEAKKQERDRGDQIFFETVAEITEGNYDLRQRSAHVHPPVSSPRRVRGSPTNECTRPAGRFAAWQALPC